VSARAAALVAVLALAGAAPRTASPLRPCPGPRDGDPQGGLAVVRCDDAPGAVPSGAARLLFGLPLDVNRADARSLDALPGIGAARAAALVQARPFCSLEELVRVPGLGPATRARLAALVEAGPAPGCPER